ncbi:uncharacterized protein LOC130591096 [Beta vulgaris subsp. vulgaris]|uniref:uncharacterized protein LOC130591096 n=1 Tax=Beta vulgaris subsp. vulgaris TaxID=3555 RepID=UPI00090105A9|nr:uncharacterized protein LOC130591096 [Beta vulgaris subsp. vulgaris]
MGWVDFEVIDLPISILTEEIVRCTKLFKDLPLKIGDCVFPSQLIEFNLGNLDIILGMNWLGFYKAEIACETHKVVLRSPLGKLTSYRRFKKHKNFRVISVMHVRKSMKKGCELFFYSVQDVSRDVGLKIEGVSIVNEFIDVFSSEISGISSIRAVEFTIYLVPGTAHILGTF